MTTRKKALVTGGATGIGRSAVLALARAGYDVAINYGSSAKAAEAVAQEAQALGAATMTLQCDVSDDAAVRQMIDAGARPPVVACLFGITERHVRNITRKN